MFFFVLKGRFFQEDFRGLTKTLIHNGPRQCTRELAHDTLRPFNHQLHLHSMGNGQGVKIGYMDTTYKNHHICIFSCSTSIGS